MCYSRSVTARVALREATSDETYWVLKHAGDCQKCKHTISSIARLDKYFKTKDCYGVEGILKLVDHSPSTSDVLESEHGTNCERCLHVGMLLLFYGASGDADAALEENIA